jgi:hypothetical protein
MFAPIPTTELVIEPLSPASAPLLNVCACVETASVAVSATAISKVFMAILQFVKGCDRSLDRYTKMENCQAANVTDL